MAVALSLQRFLGLPRLLLLLFLSGLPDNCMALGQTGLPRCWGLNTHGQLDVPVTATQDIAPGESNTCGIDEVGLWCVGHNPQYPLVVPSDLTDGTSARQVVMGQRFACVLLADDTVRCFGLNNYGQTAVPQGLGAVQQLTAGWIHACALLKTASITCWGWGGFARTSPPSGQFTQVVSGTVSEHSCALLVSGTARCWGWNAHGQCDVPPDLAGKVKQLGTGFGHSCALLEDGAVRCWGWNNNGQTDVPPNLPQVDQISVGAFHSCALHQNNVTCWGDNREGQSAVPAEITKGGTALEVIAGAWFTCALLATSTTTTSSTSMTLTTSSTAQCLVNNVMSCSAVPPGTYEVQCFTKSSEHFATATAAMPDQVIRMNTSLCPPNRTGYPTTVVDTYLLHPLVENTQWRDLSKRSVLCSCVSPRNGMAGIDFRVPTLPPLEIQPGTGSFKFGIQMCANATCEASATAAAPGAPRFHFLASSHDLNDEIELRRATTCPGPNRTAPECRTLVSDNCMVEPSLQMSLSRDGHRVFWSTLPFAWKGSPTMHMFVEMSRCDTASKCGICASGAPAGGARRLQPSPQGALTELAVKATGDELVVLVPFPYQSLRSSGGSVSVPREVQVQLVSAGNVSSDGLVRAAIAGLDATAPEVQVTGVALLRQLDSQGQGQVGLILSVSINVPVASVQDHSQLETGVLAELARLGLAKSPTPTSTAKPEAAEHQASATNAISSHVWMVSTSLLGWGLCGAGVGF